jgi:8-amino-7-oxononanoate synthase
LERFDRMSDAFAEQIQALRARSLDRHLREIGTAQGPIVQLGGKRLMNFSSNDYLGLANDPKLREAAIAGIREFGVGAGASRLISGTQSPHLRLEKALAAWKGSEAALCFSSGYAAAVGTLPALLSKRDVVLLDKLCHASLIDGARLSRAILRVFPHNHLGKLESHLHWARLEHPGSRVVVVTESVFSMDGDRAPLRDLIDLKKRFDAFLFLDEAHAVGVLGANGRGLAAEENVTADVDIQMGTLSKALGVSGGYICGSAGLIEWLINRARSFIFSTAPPAALATAALAVLEFLSSREGEERRRLLWRNIDLLGKALSIKPASAIVPWIVGDEQAALDLSKSLQAQRFFVPAIRYPTVARGSARLRITVSAAHEEDQIRSFAAAIQRPPQSDRAAIAPPAQRDVFGNSDQGVRDEAQ